jgi:ribosomal protein S18 acetylase RimI-like enzyme
MIRYQLSKNEEELEQILDLQRRNLPRNLSALEKKEQGFVTVEHSLIDLKKLSDIHPHCIAKFNNKVIGYALSMDVSCREDIEVLKPMFKKIDTFYKDAYIIMGQVCIDKDYRGKGVFKELYRFMKTHFSYQYNAIITEIDLKNTPSIKAHQKIGFTELTRYTSNNKEWSIVMLKC